MPDPTNLDEYNRLQNLHQSITGFGLGNVRISTPCPFCCAPDFRSYLIEEVEKVCSEDVTCKACGRGAKMIFHHQIGVTRFEMVQTRGVDPAPYLPRFRRTDHPIVTPYPVNPHG